MKTVVALAAKEFTSISAEQSVLQAEYAKLFAEECSAKEVNSPFELDEDALKSFFDEISSKWKARKLELYKDGKIDETKL